MTQGHGGKDDDAGENGAVSDLPPRPAASDHSTPPGRRPWLSSLRGRLVLLTLAILVPAILSAALLLGAMDRQARHAQEAQLVETARALSLVIDREFGQQAAILQALSASGALRRGDFAAFRGQAIQAVADPNLWVVINDKAGQQLVNTRAPAGAPLPVTPESANGFSWAGARGAGVQVSNLFYGPVAGRHVFLVQKDVRLADGRVVELAVVGEAAKFQRVFRDQALPSAWTSSIIDARNHVVARNRDADRLIGKSPTPVMIRNLETARTGVAPSMTLDGIPTYSAWSKLPGYGWAVIVGVPRAEFAATAAQPLRWGLILAIVLLTSGLAIALWVARSVARPVEGLAEAARRWGEGWNVPLAPTRIAETDDLAVALARAVRAVERRESELRELNETLEARVGQATESLIQAQRLEAVGRLTGGVAHDFNNILMVAASGLQLMEKSGDPDRRRVLADAVRNALDRGAALTRQLLTFSRRDAVRPEAVDLERRVEGMRVLLDRSLREDITVSVQAEPDLWPVKVDAAQLELALLNIAVNARDAMPAGGPIEIVMRNRPALDLGSGPFDAVEIAVVDRGVGMDAETVARVFEPFFTTKPVGKGTGLGLSQVYGFVQSAAGEVRIDSEPGKGATVRLFLPRAHETPTPSAPGPVVDGARRDGRILVVEDDPAVAAMVQDLLRSIGFTPVHAADAESALAMLARDETIDLVFSDMVMPGAMNGAELAHEVAARHPGLPIILTTGYSDAAGAAAEAGFRLLPKPYALATLAETLDAALAQARRP